MKKQSQQINERFLKETTLTRLQGIRSYISLGVVLGELDLDMNLADLLHKVEEMMNCKNKLYEDKIKDMKRDGIEDEVFN